MKVLVTGAAGFIGYHVSEALLRRGDEVLGVDSLNAYYDPALKRARLERLRKAAGFRFEKLDIADWDGIDRCFAGYRPEAVIHLAAQAGVRYSLENPKAYLQDNLTGHLAILEACRALPDLAHLVYASSSSVYGGNDKLPFSEIDRVDAPVSLYAATKASDELMSRVYAGLYGLKQTGLRFFTVYGPWGRPDMAYYRFADKIVRGEPIELYNYGRLERDFTYIDDAVAGVLGVLDRPPRPEEGKGTPHRILNVGSGKPIALETFVATLEEALGAEATVCRVPMQPGDVRRTLADITAIRSLTGYEPATGLTAGLVRFAEWFRAYGREDTVA